MLWFTESTGLIQVEDPTGSLGAEDSTIQTSAGEPSAVEFAVALVAAEAATTTTIPEILAATSVSDEPVVSLTPVHVELVFVSRPVMERGFGSTSASYLQLMIS